VTNDQWNSAVIKTIREHAVRNYNSGGWDYIVESYEDFEILDICKGLGTLDACIAAVGRIVRCLDERRKEIQNA
jgi:2-polyprenyl-3-methyl-5-hydroxy-6-metoxy-1,4-benzoquinol methylase